jgi:predicted transcriptional regulator YheO
LDIAKPDKANVQQKEAVENAQHRESKESTQGQEYKPVRILEESGTFKAKDTINIVNWLGVSFVILWA